jgi:hypothetical protein
VVRALALERQEQALAHLVAALDAHEIRAASRRQFARRGVPLCRLTDGR